MREILADEIETGTVSGNFAKSGWKKKIDFVFRCRRLWFRIQTLQREKGKCSESVGASSFATAPRRQHDHGPASLQVDSIAHSTAGSGSHIATLTWLHPHAGVDEAFKRSVGSVAGEWWKQVELTVLTIPLWPAKVNFCFYPVVPQEDFFVIYF